MMVFDSRCLRILVAALCALGLAAESRSQTDGLLHLNDDAHHFLQRQQALGTLRGAFLDEQPLSAYRARRYLDSLAVIAEENPGAFSPDDLLRLRQFRGDQPLTGAAAINRRVGWLYGNGQDFFSVEEGAFRMQINPKLYLSAGMARESEVAGESPRGFLYQNTRAVRVSGGIGERFFFHTQLEENQRIEPMVARQRTRDRLPLSFQADSSMFDYMISTAALGYRDRYVELQFGRGQQRWGPAMGSLYLSSHAPPHTWLQARAEVWRVSFTAHYAILDDVTMTPPTWQHFSGTKYGAFHRVGLSLPGRVNLGFFEAIILSFMEEDRELGNYIRFLNPLIFFNALDRTVGSPGNVLVGLDANWVAMPGVAVYGQFILDDFEAEPLLFQPGYWKNTWGVLAGVHLVDPGVPGLDVRAEYSRVRPYVYANVRGELAHTQRHGFLGSPAGPNSSTLSMQATYLPVPRVRAAVTGFTLLRGRSTEGRNYGEDPHIPHYLNRPSDDEVFTLQGIRQSRQFLEARLGYEVLPAFWLEGVVQSEVFTDADLGSDRSTAVMLQLRWGMPAQHPLY